MSLCAREELPEHAEAQERSSSVLHSVFQGRMCPGRIMPGAKHKQNMTALVKAAMVQVVERVVKSETVAQKVFRGVLAGLKLCLSPA